jgi:ATP-dependent Clp protease ATP-binding subunit ClpC
MNDLGIQFEISDAVKDFIAEKGWSQQYGARPLKRTIQKHIEDLLAEEIIKGSIQQGDKIIVDWNAETEEIFVMKNEGMKNEK